MKVRQIIFPAFILMVIVQLFVPASMIFKQENILKTGSTFKFKTAPVDPYDPFRGKYIWLNFEANQIGVTDKKDWEYNAPIYVKFKTDENGFAAIKGVSKKRPEQSEDFVEARVSHLFKDSLGDQLVVEYPFNRFYMKETKAYEAEVKYREASRDENIIAYALVKIKNGEAVIENVFLDEIPIGEIVE